MKIIYDINTWFSARYAIWNFWALREKFGKKTEGMNKYQKEREAWILGVTLLGIIQLTKKLWWLQIPLNDPPDMLAMTLTPNEDKNMNFVDYREVEILEIVKYSKGTLTEEIKRKLKKSYIKETALVVYLRRDTNITDMRKLSIELKQNSINIADVWVLGNTLPNTNNFILFSLFPDVQVVNFVIENEVSKIPIGDTIQMAYGKGTRGKLMKVPIRKFNPKNDFVITINL